ncbi:MAG TPA: hypothetical protein VNN18_01625 [Candidatus Xenobia bacterium]|nr:hypothetical protein [Candidatus Xenobia bacterium]
MSSPGTPRASFINLPHAHTIVGRLVRWFEGMADPAALGATPIPELLAELDRCLRSYAEDPPEAEAVPAAEETAQVARQLVEAIERTDYRGDRLGQCVRNLFECLGLAEEGAALSLRCGERPDSPLRP